MEINEQLNSILMAAYNEAKNRRHEYLTPEHILYASLHFETAQNLISSLGAKIGVGFGTHSMKSSRPIIIRVYPAILALMYAPVPDTGP